MAHKSLHDLCLLPSPGAIIPVLLLIPEKSISIPPQGLCTAIPSAGTTTHHFGESFFLRAASEAAPSTLYSMSQYYFHHRKGHSLVYLFSFCYQSVFPSTLHESKSPSISQHLAQGRHSIKTCSEHAQCSTVHDSQHKETT